MKRHLNLTLIALLAAGVAALAWKGSSYYSQVAITTMIFVILTASLNYVTGSAGLLTLGHAAFFGVGAYTAALLSTKLGWAFWFTLPVSGAVAAVVGALVAVPTMRLTSIYFASKVLSVRTGSPAAKIAQAFYVGEIVKLLLTVLLLGAAFLWLPVAPLPLLLAYWLALPFTFHASTALVRTP